MDRLPKSFKRLNRECDVREQGTNGSPVGKELSITNDEIF
jgi:hypothetical protein